MKDNDEFLKKMENLQVPDINPGEHPKMVKMAIMNTERSAALGVWLIVAPCYFLFCVCMYYFFHLRLSWFESMFNLMASLDKNPWLRLLSPVLLVILPMVCIVINALAIVHVGVQKAGPDQDRARELGITIKIKPWNILLILLSLAIVFTFLAYIVTENIVIKN
ncbi:hypothetical protein [Mucilaginibacter flavidus]|uniref:hypothetical protein n=1 Tax=Mucilaginibacter flavidus TaxID=2949309 RepID=UPI002093B71A|nr:hypothetical protein [Mucilaginibacter flavidus]MCO5950511.1 hypothetical protein [Mucilaginibacter flavidus]